MLEVNEDTLRVLPLALGFQMVVMKRLKDFSERPPAEETQALQLLEALSSIWPMQNDEVVAAILPQVKSHWATLRSWTGYFYENRLRTTSQRQESTNSKKELIATLCGVFLYLTASIADLPWLTQEFSKPDTLDILAGMWVADDTKIDLNTERLLTPINLMHLAMNVAQAEGRTDRVHGAILKAAHGKVNNIAVAALRPLRKLERVANIDLNNVMFFVLFIAFLMPNGDSDFFLPLLSNGAASIIAKALDVVWAQTMQVSSGVDWEKKMTLTSIGYTAICVALQGRHGPSWAKAAVQAGLLDAIVNCSPSFGLFPKDTREDIQYILKELLPNYLVYRSTLMPTVESMKKLMSSTSMEKIERSELKEEWKFFSKFVLERATVLADFSSSGGDDLDRCDKVSMLFSHFRSLAYSYIVSVSDTMSEGSSRSVAGAYRFITARRSAKRKTGNSQATDGSAKYSLRIKKVTIVDRGHLRC